MSVSRVTRSARAPTAIRPASSKPSDPCPSYVAAREQLVGRPVAALPGGEPLVELDGPHLLEQVDDRVAVGAERERRRRPRAAAGDGPMPSPRSRSVVGQKQAWVPRAAEQRDVARRSGGWRARRVVRGAERAGLGEQLGRASRRRPPGRRRSRRPARRGARAAGAACARPSRRPCGIWSRGTARTEWIAAPHAPPTRHASGRRGVRRRRARRAGGPGVRVAVAEPPLHALGRPADPGGEVAGVQQRDPDPGLAGGRDQRVRHRVRVVVRRAARAVVQVVELADAW